MDVIYLALAGLFWLLTVALVKGCERLQRPEARP
ncbi:MAG: potassium ABC transporter ATPase [Giesbergeria sp.]|nr:potassium ABC transporter ATPase [Giesbergeria sp.]MBP6159580.1 potassium ABC transporter ATPase [Giesbergeria sp.]MBP7084824.1 potassium ABC transporter ATPase [Giesbergeria sp.]